jgi:alkyl sulfatase BDS1-like metallo-beta-lactamase superfamily hydrolase
VEAGRVKIIAPYGFMDETVAENIIAGNAMSRRSQYQFGITLPVLDDGTGFATLGGALQMSHGETTLIAPTLTLPEGPGEITKLEVDGVEIFFKDISGAEAPSAALLYVPKYKLIFNSELFARGLHNVYTLRGALVRDALQWSKYINEVLLEWGDDVEIMTGPHSPAFVGNEKIQEYLRLQRDNVGFIHNQSVRLANKGIHIQDVGDAIDAMVPESQRAVWHTNGYHGTYNHNARGVVNRYLGFYDGNPANLNPLPTGAEATKFVEYMGGADAILRKARADFEKGEYRWVATAVNKVVVADPDNWKARHLLADAFEQLGYQAEGPQWRHPYLSAAWELRVGQVMEIGISSSSPDVLLASRVEDLLDLLAVLLISEKAEGLSITMNIVLSDTEKLFFVELANANLSSARIGSPRKADTTITIAENDLKLVLLGQTTVGELETVGRASVEGTRGTLQAIASRLDSFSPDFPLVPMPTKSTD